MAKKPESHIYRDIIAQAAYGSDDLESTTTEHAINIKTGVETIIRSLAEIPEGTQVLYSNVDLKKQTSFIIESMLEDSFNWKIKVYKAFELNTDKTSETVTTPNIADVGKIQYDREGKLLFAELPLTDWDGDQANDYSDYFIYIEKTAQSIASIRAFFYDASEGHSILINHDENYQAKFNTSFGPVFTADWSDLTAITLKVSNTSDGFSKTLQFPALIDTSKISLLHQHLDQARFPTEDIHAAFSPSQSSFDDDRETVV